MLEVSAETSWFGGSQFTPSTVPRKRFFAPALVASLSLLNGIFGRLYLET